MEPGDDQTPEQRVKILHASGMVTEQAGCSADDALVLMRERAAEIGSSLEDVAVAVVDRRIDFR